MEINIITAEEAKYMGISHSRMTSQGHGAFGEPDNTYVQVVTVGDEIKMIHDTDLILYTEDSGNRVVLQIISEYQASDKLLETLLPELLEKRWDDKYKQYMRLKNEIENHLYDMAPKPNILPKFTKPFRVGRKQTRTVLDAKGHEVVVFPVGQENMASAYCDFLNSSE